MKKNILNILMWTMALVFVAGFTACSDDDTIDRNYGVNNDEVYFPSTLPKTVVLDINATSFDVELRRVRTADAITVPIEVTDESGLFTIPTSVSFDEGADKAVLSIGYNLDEINYGDFKTIVLKIANADLTSPYGASSYTFSAGLNEPWSSLGNGLFSDYFMADGTYTVEIQQNDVDPTVFRLVNPYAQILKNEGYPTQGGPSEYVQFRILQPGQTIGETTVTMENLVYFNDYYTGWYHTNYEAEVMSFWPGRFVSLSAEENWTHNCVLSYQENGKPAIVQLAPYYYMDGIGGWNYTQRDGVVTIVFPGVTVYDSSIEVTHTGFFHDVNDNVSVVADITLGKDVAEAKVALVQGNDGNAGANDIIDGLVESISITSSGEVKIPMPEDAEDGKYSIVAVSYIDGEAQEYDYATFTFTSDAKEEWKEINTGTYSYSLFWEGDDSGLAFSQSLSDPQRFKISDWGGGVDFIFTIDEHNNVMVADQEVGYVHPTYGDVYVTDIVEYTGNTEMGQSSYANGVFTFNVVYYCGAGTFAYGPETFTLDTKTQAPRKAAAAAAAKAKKLGANVGITRAQMVRNLIPSKAIRQ